MTDSPERSAARLIPWGLLGMLALVVTIEQFLLGADLRFTSNVRLSWRFASQHAQGNATQAKVLCFGDSLMQFGVYPPVIQRRTGKQAFNLAVHGGVAPTSYFLLRRALNSGARPSAIMVDFVANNLKPRASSESRPWADLVTVADAIDLAWNMRDADLFATILVGKMLPTFLARHDIRAWIRAGFKAESSKSRKRSVAALSRNWEVNAGAEVLAKTVVPEEPEPVPLPPRLSLFGTWTCDEINALYLERFFAMTETRGIPVFWLLPPVGPSLQWTCEFQGIDSDYEQFVRTVQARHPGLIVVDGRHRNFKSRVFLDNLHLNREGGTVLSADLGELLLARSLASETTQGPRWVHLPTYRDQPIEFVLEDCSQSLEALHRQRRKGVLR